MKKGKTKQSAERICGALQRDTEEKCRRGSGEKFDRCAAQHFGLWSIEPHWFSRAVEAVKNGTWQPSGSGGVQDRSSALSAFLAAEPMAQRERSDFQLTSDGVALIEIVGQMVKGESSFGGASTVRLRRAIRAAAADSDVRGILLIVDSPGGTVAGTAELADDVAAAARQKPLHVFVDDLAASAAFWVASQADVIAAGRTAMVGSIGVFAVVVDSSKAAEERGFEVHVISTGKFKGAAVPGTEITDEQLEHFQEQVDDLNAHFLRAVSEGRKMTFDDVRELADGRVHIAAKALKLGMIDRVATLDDSVEELRSQIALRSRRRSTRAAIARAAINLSSSCVRREADA